MSDLQRSVLIFPDNIRPFENQIAGHVYQKGKLTIRMMKDLEGNLMKPYVTSKEINFYNMLETTTDPLLMELKQYVPSYFGTTNLQLNNDEDISCICIEDITKDLELPCIMDVKIGVRTWEPDAPECVILSRMAQYVAMRKSWGFYIPGFQYYSGVNGSFVREGRDFGHRMSPQEAIHVLYNFVHGEAGIRYGLVDSILQHLQKIRSWFQRQREFSFFDSSILLVHDAKTMATYHQYSKSRDDEAKKTIDSKIKVRMIDFAKVIPNVSDKIDENYLTSLERLIYVFENLADLHAEMVHGTISAYYRKRNKKLTSLV